MVRDISLELRAGEVVALIGESGSGKSTIARAISGRLPPRAGVISLDGAVLAPTLKDRSVEELRQVQYIFQNPDASLNPRRRIRAILARAVDHFGIETDDKALETALENVGLHAGYLDRFPEQLSGGERQRVAIARALLVNPKLLICDEILSALDVSVQARIVELLRSLKEKHAVAMLFISHDLAVVQEFADRVAVLYRGELMQLADTATLLSAPRHPYTEMLIEAAPGLRKDNYIPRPPASPSVTPQPAAGRPLAGRCPQQIGRICVEERPPYSDHGQQFRPMSSRYGHVASPLNLKRHAGSVTTYGIVSSFLMEVERYMGLFRDRRRVLHASKVSAIKGSLKETEPMIRGLKLNFKTPTLIKTLDGERAGWCKCGRAT